MMIAPYSVHVLNAGGFKLDGGSLFGVVPRALWARNMPPDDANRVLLACNCLLLRREGSRFILVETGCGDKFDARARDIYAIQNPGGILHILAGMGVAPEQIDAVVVSHLHFDHAGGLTTLDPAGKPVPAFPNARIFVQRTEWQDALSNFSHMKSTYLPENLTPLADTGLVVPVDGPAEVLPGIRVEPAPGHTRGSQTVIIGNVPGPRLCFIGDIVPTRHHLRPFWTTAYDTAPQIANDTRADLVGRAAREGWTVVFPHDPDQPAGRVALDEKGRWALERL